MDITHLEQELELLRKATRTLAAGFATLPPYVEAFDGARIGAVLDETARRLRDSYPFHHPLYAGQMLQPPHPVARLACALAQRINPNNHALEGGPASSALEKEAVAALARMIGWDTHLGHLCGGGTLANLEALWVASRLHPGRRVLASSQAHYTHQRLSALLGVPFTAVEVDAEARLDPAALERELAVGDVGTVVVTLGTTALGAVDPLPEVLALARRHGVRVHVDAAYGGYFRLAAAAAPRVAAALAAIAGADSCVIDPHKHGLQPYGCGCVLFRDPAVARFYRHDSPYTYFSSDELHLGEISLECSRPGAVAVALWATQRLLPLEPAGEFAAGLDASLAAARALYARLRAEPRFLTVLEPQFDVVAWAPAATQASEVARRSRQLFAAAARQGLHLSVAELPASLLARRWTGVSFDTQRVACLRACLIKPAHLEWLDVLWERLLEASWEERSSSEP
ncbi:MAG: Histidine decarboxylase [Pseudomonadales bacterium]|nr:Histidine decarboxylase [Pseudomonadales bacterium]